MRNRDRAAAASKAHAPVRSRVDRAPRLIGWVARVQTSRWLGRRPMATQHSGTVTKALRLLDEFLDGSAELSLRELAARSGMHKTTILRLFASLEEVGFLEREP